MAQADPTPIASAGPSHTFGAAMGGVKMAGLAESGILDRSPSPASTRRSDPPKISSTPVSAMATSNSSGYSADHLCSTPTLSAGAEPQRSPCSSSRLRANSASACIRFSPVAMPQLLSTRHSAARSHRRPRCAGARLIEEGVGSAAAVLLWLRDDDRVGAGLVQLFSVSPAS